MFENKETCCFMHLVCRFLTDEHFYLLPIKEYEKTRTDKILLGYYDDEYIYLIPNAVIGRCNFMLRKNGLKEFNMQKILHNLFACNLIKVHWILTCDIRYRPQKRVGKTKKRYIRFIRRELETRMLLEDLGL